jgi:hypothetical protein
LCQFNSSENLIDAIKLFIDYKIDVDEKTNDGKNALYYLRQYNSSEKSKDAIQLMTQFRKIQIDSPSVPLGEGGFGLVFLGRFNGRQVAVKKVEMHKVNNNEEKVLTQLSHPNVVKLLHSESDDSFK